MSVFSAQHKLDPLSIFPTKCVRLCIYIYEIWGETLILVRKSKQAYSKKVREPKIASELVSIFSEVAFNVFL